MEMVIDRQLMYVTDEILLGLMIFLIMFGMGASLTVNDFKAVGRRPRGVLIGFMSQFGIMPLAALGLSVALNLPAEIAVALILIGCLPGGTTSNMFAYFARGSVALSICMTTASTVVALFMVPLLLEVYTADFARQISEAMQAGGQEDYEFIIPHSDIIQSLAVVLIPVGMGMLLRRWSPLWAKTAEDTGSFFAIIVILYLLGTAIVRHGTLFLQTPWQIYASAVCLGLLGFAFGLLVAKAFRQPPIFQRAISLETGIQNTPVSFAIILMSFTDPIQDPMLWLAILYATFIVATSSVVTLLYRRFGKYDWEVYKNTVIHNRLFGPNYVTHYPDGFLKPPLDRDPSQGSIPAQQRSGVSST